MQRTLTGNPRFYQPTTSDLAFPRKARTTPPTSASWVELDHVLCPARARYVISKDATVSWHGRVFELVGWMRCRIGVVRLRCVSGLTAV